MSTLKDKKNKIQRLKINQVFIRGHNKSNYLDFIQEDQAVGVVHIHHQFKRPKKITSEKKVQEIK